jgi:pimeloyl-ACP methyl ester carboxylesterase
MASAIPTGGAVRPPSALYALTELPRALAEWGTLSMAAGPLLAAAPRGDGHPVLVLPGFMTTDASTAVLRRFLRRLGYDACEWGLGRNLGPRAVGREGEKLVAKIREIHDRTGQKVSLVGWSLGGVLARMVARRAPDAVRQIITLGSPFAGTPKATTVWRLYEMMSGDKVDDRYTQGMIAEGRTAPPVPSTAIYSKEDGVVAWQNCVEPESGTTDNIEVHGSHCGLGVNASVLYAVADRLAQAEDGWAPFHPTGLKSWAYPHVGHA